MKKTLIGAFLFTALLSCSRQQYVVSNIQAERYPVKTDQSIQSNTAVDDHVSKYKTMLDKEMNQVIGHSSQDMIYGIPESLLTNLTSDAMLKYTKSNLDSECDLAIMNVNGHRSNLAKGNITLGNMFEIYSFENALTIVKIKGSDLEDTFKSYAKMGGYGISSTAYLVIKDGKLMNAAIDGKPVDKDKIYTLVTLDYLAEGNDGMESLKKATEKIDTGITLRDIMIEYIKEETAQGHEISSKLDGRITVEK